MKFYTNSCNLLLPKAYWFLFALTANVRKMVELMDSILLDYESWWHCLTALWYQPGLKSVMIFSSSVAVRVLFCEAFPSAVLNKVAERAGCTKDDYEIFFYE
ncbi:hypothetical protein QQP08_006005 [Theobroma cacao]|nr:hypothetical protein QQP08_006005 [Theobroma cacao]